MTREFVFDGVLEPLPWGRNVYVVIRVPAGLEEAARAWPTRRVEGRIDDVAVNLGLNRAQPAVLADAFVYAGPGLRRRLGLDPGDAAACRLRPAGPDAVLVPDDVRTALEDGGRLPAFERLTPGRRRRLLTPVENAVREATRAQRIAALVRELAAG
ncbi:YdeI/OmpD-associated family protein [Geodermatophilus sp. SYSU D01045]